MLLVYCFFYFIYFSKWFAQQLKLLFHFEKHFATKIGIKLINADFVENKANQIFTYLSVIEVQGANK